MTRPTARRSRDERPTWMVYSPGGTTHSPSIHDAKARRSSSIVTRRLLAAGQVDAAEPGEVAQRPGRIAGRRLDVHLDDLGTVPIAGVGHVDVDGDAVLDAAGERRVAELERRVAEAEAEREQRLDALAVVPAVPDEQPLGVHRPARPCPGSGRTPACPRAAGGTSPAAGRRARRRRSARRPGRRRSPGRGTTAAARPARRRATASSPASRC